MPYLPYTHNITTVNTMHSLTLYANEFKYKGIRLARK